MVQYNFIIMIKGGNTFCLIPIEDGIVSLEQLILTPESLLHDILNIAQQMRFLLQQWSKIIYIASSKQEHNN